MTTEKIMNELENDFLIVRSDGIVLRDRFGFPETLCSNWKKSYIDFHINSINSEYKRLFRDNKYTFSIISVVEYKKDHPDFKF